MPEEPFKKKETPASPASPRRVEAGPELKRGESFAPLRTMQEDIKILSKEGYSPADVMTRESVFLGERERLAREFASARWWRIALIAGIAAAFLIGAGTIGFFLFFSEAPVSQKEIAPVFLPIPAASQEEIQFRLGDREGLLTLLHQRKQRVTKAQQPVFFSLKLFSLDASGKTERQARLAESRQANVFEVFQTLRLRPPPSLLQTFGQEIYLYVLADAFVFIIPINNPQKALEGFLAWEPFMARDFAPLLPADAFLQPFKDRVIGNVDARVFSSLGYALFGGRYAIIALAEPALRETIERLAKR